jgi:hypothetical protein
MASTPTAESSPWSRFLDVVAAWSHRVGGGLLVAAVGSRTLFPAEDAAEGTGLYFVPLAVACGLCYVVERTAGVRGPRFRWVGWAWGLVLLGWLLSAQRAGYRYAAEVMFWEWAGVAAVCLYARHWQAAGGPKSLAALALAAALHQSLLSALQLGYELPALRELEQRGDPSYRDAMRKIGVQPGTHLERALRDRLYAMEPYGSTGHPNTLAGLLLLATPLAWTLACSNLGRRGWRIAGTATALLLTLVVVAALVATRSRSAWIGLIASLVALFSLRRSPPGWWKRNVWRLAAAGAAVLLIVAGLTAAGVLDALVVGESFKSMQYRWEWWQASAAVIAEQPVFGVGAGSFRDFYLKHKLPFSSEEIADPHNFVIELWATGGVLTLFAYLATLGLLIRNAVVPGRPADDEPAAGLGVDVYWLAGVLVATGWVAAFHFGPAELASPTLQWLKLGLFPASAVLVSLMGGAGVSWSAPAVRRAVVAGVVGLHVHWLASGGVGFPSMTLLTFALLGVCTQEPNDPRPVPFRTSFLSAAVWSCAMVAFAFFWLAPRIERDLIDERLRRIEHRIEKAQASIAPATVAPRAWLEMQPIYDLYAAETRLFAEAVPGDRTGWERWAAAETGRMRLAERLGSATAETAYRNAETAWKQAAALAPRRSETHRQLALLYRETAASGRDPKAADLALDAYQACVERYPNSARQRWELADLYLKRNQRTEAAAEFREALRLDQTPHLDRKLYDGQRRIAEQHLRSLE